MQVNGINSVLTGGAPRVDPFNIFDVEFQKFGATQKVKSPIAVGDDSQGPSFIEVLQGAINDVQKTKNESEQISYDYAMGKPIDVHTMMIAIAKADIAMQLTSAVVSKTATSVNQLLQTQI